MSEHAWVLENVATWLTGGLDTSDLERLERHLDACPQCAEAVQQARSFDDTMRGLFSDAQPDPALEDRMIQSLRVSARPRWRPWPLYRRLAVGTAAVVMLCVCGVLGAFVADTIEQGHLIFPGTSQRDQAVVTASSTPSLAQVSGGTTMTYDDGLDLSPRQILASRTRREAVAFDELGSGALSSDGAGYYVTPPNDIELYAYARTEGYPGGLPERTTQGMDSGYAGMPHDESGRVADSRWSHPTTKSPDTSTSEVEYRRPLEQGAGSEYTRIAGPTARRPTLQSTLTVNGAETAGGDGRYPAGADDTLVAGAGALGRSIASLDDTPYYGSASSLVTAAPETAVAVQLYFKPDNLLVGLEAIQAVPLQQGVVKGPTLALVEQDGPEAEPEQADDLAEVEVHQAQPAAVTQRKVIRSGEMEFEVDSFDSAVEKITGITTEEGGFIATVDSEQLPNGKMRGSVVIRVLPERLDTLVLKLRALGELKNQKIGSQDITKQYTDLESRLRAARAMEERLLEMIKNGKGEIEHLLKAEKELGLWRTKIEETEGELRYYNNVVALSTLKITLAEKEIRAAAALTETERVQMGIEVEDVEQAHQEALKAVDEANGLVTKSELKQHEAEQYSAVINFEIDRDAAGPLRDRLRQIGRVARLDIDRVQQADGGSGLPRDARTVRKDTQFSVSLYNVANVAPRETTHVNLACTDTEAAYKTILERVQQAGGRVVTSSLKSQHSQKTTGSVQFELPVAESDAVLMDVKAAGEVMRLEVTENPDSKNVTKSKRGFNVELWAMALVAPRETIVLQIATEDVPAGYRMLQAAVDNANGRILNAQLNEQDKQNITARLDFDIPRDDQPVLDSVGEVFSRNVTRSQDDENVIDSKVRVQVALIDQARIPPRETITLGIEVGDVDQVTAALSTLVEESQGRTVESHLAHERSGRVTAKVVFDVPLASGSDVVEKFKASGTVRAQQSTRNPQVPDGKLAIARLEVTLSNAELIVPSDGGLLAQVRTGLATSFTAISWSLTVVIVGLCFVLPWALVLYAVYRVIARIRRKASPAQTTA
jgi:glycine cleavage system regulatory protein